MLIYKNAINPYRTGKRWERILFSKYKLITAKLNVGNFTEYTILARQYNIFATTEDADKLFLGIERVGCFSFPTHSFIHPEYVCEKLNVGGGDAGNIADWLNTQLDIYAEEYGRYEDELCIDREEE